MSIRKSGSGGMTALEIMVVLVIAGIIAAGGAAATSGFGSRSKVREEASKVVDNLWELRSKAITGVQNPCMDFPAVDSVRFYSDANSTPDGFGIGDRLLGGYRYKGGVKALSLVGGQGSTHFVCFQSRGMTGSASVPLDLILGVNASVSIHVRLLPSTGIAKIR